jgi:hypothetical protein
MNKGVIIKDVLIIGAGASGLMCAIEAGRRGRSVLVIDHNEKIAKKVRVSGGGRCNFTNLQTDAGHYISSNTHFCKSALARFGPEDITAMLERHNIEYSEREKGQLFCTGSSAEIVSMLNAECRRAGAEIMLNCRVSKITKTGRFFANTSAGRIESGSLIIATGGLSYPELGATDIGYRLAKEFGLRVTPLRPALVPLVYGPYEKLKLAELSGVSLDSIVKLKKISFRGDLLFTHRGLSGPAALQISSYWNEGDRISINLLPDSDALGILISKQQSRTELPNLLAEYLPRRLSRKWCELYASSRPLCTYTEKELRKIASDLHDWKLLPETTEGYKKAEITAGGVDTDGISSRTMEAATMPGLYFIGEVLDVAGQLGGYNLHWAWASGFTAGQYA